MKIVFDIEAWAEQAKKRSIEKFGYNIVGLDLDKVESYIRHRSERSLQSYQDMGSGL